MFIDETWATHQHGPPLRTRCPRGERCGRRAARPCVDAPSGASRISGRALARGRVLPCVRPLMRPSHAAGPYGSARVEIHITGTRSKRSPCAWFSRPRLTDVAPYLSVDLLTPSDSLASAPPTRGRPELDKPHPSSAAPRRCARSCWPAPRSPASAACALASGRATSRPARPCAWPSARPRSPR